MKKSIHFTAADEKRRVLRAKKANDARSVRKTKRQHFQEAHDLDKRDARALALAEELISRADDEGMSIFAYLQREAAEVGQ